MISSSGNTPALLIKELRRDSDKPILKGAYVEEMVYIGDSQLDALIKIKSKNEMIGDVIFLLQSPVRNVISALQSGGNKLSGIVKTLSERPL
jgi:large subunit ribosomal protein L10